MVDQSEEEVWYICRDVVDMVVSNIVLPTFNNQRQTGEENTSIDWFWKVVRTGEHLLRGEGLGKANSFLETSVTQVANQSHTLPACLSPMKSTSKTQTPQPYLTDSTPVDWTPQRVNPNDSILVPQLLRRSNRKKAKGEMGTPLWLKELRLETTTDCSFFVHPLLSNDTSAAELLLVKTDPRQNPNL